MDTPLLVAGLFISIFIIALVITLLTNRFNPQNKWREKKMEQITLLLQKVSSTTELSDFLKSEEGKKLLELMEPKKSSLKSRLLRLFIPAFLFLIAGSWLSYNSVILSTKLDIAGNILHLEEMMRDQFLGSWCVYIGLALLVAGGILYVVERLKPSPTN